VCSICSWRCHHAKTERGTHSASATNAHAAEGHSDQVAQPSDLRPRLPDWHPVGLSSPSRLIRRSTVRNYCKGSRAEIRLVLIQLCLEVHRLAAAGGQSLNATLLERPLWTGRRYGATGPSSQS